jgi:hypothetical protein
MHIPEAFFPQYFWRGNMNFYLFFNYILRLSPRNDAYGRAKHYFVL